MDMRFIEVCIGLVLVFALTSLLVSMVVELWASASGRRGANLELALRSLLANDPGRGGLRGLLSRDAPPSPFTQAMLRHPLMVSQSQGAAGVNGKPSYLPGDLVVATLLSVLTGGAAAGARPDTPQTLVNALLSPAAGQAAVAPPKELVGALQALMQGVEGDWPAYERRLVAWFDSVAERSTGWFKRWNQVRLLVFGFLLAALFNINPVVIALRLWDEEPLRRAMVSAAESASQVYNAAQAASGPAAPAQAGGVAAQAPKPAPVAATAASLDLDRALKRLSGQVDSMALPDARSVQLKLDLDSGVEATGETVRHLRESLADVDVPERLLGLYGSADQQLLDLHRQAKGAGLGAVADEAVRVRVALQAERMELLLQALPNAQGQRCRRATTAEARALCERIESVRSAGDGGLPLGWHWENIPGCRDGECAERPASAQSPAQVRLQLRLQLAADGAANKDCQAKEAKPGKAAPAQKECLQQALATDAARLHATALAQQAWSSAAEQLKRTPEGGWAIVQRCVSSGVPCDWSLMLAGWLLLAVAATLGAPFWFDLLGRLIKLRAAGAKPGSGDGKAEGAAPAGDKGQGPGSGMLAPPTQPGGAPAPRTSSTNLSEAEAKLGTEQIAAIQRDGLKMPAGEISGQLDAATRTAIAQFQAKEGASPADGVLTAAQIARLLRGTAPPATAAPAAPAAPSARGLTPLRSDGTIAPLSEQEIRDLYGDIDTVPKPGSKGWVDVVSTGKPGGPQLKLKRLQHAALQAIAPQGLEVHELAEPYFRKVFDDIQAAGLAGHLVKTGGTLASRHIGQDPARRLSSHTWGIAIDLNPDQNGWDKTPAADGQPGSLSRIVPLFAKHGFAWGGDFKNSPLDGMHFELALRRL
jgi:peptidoglycan hydrolase-like protein with peptidoglycan-binding domain